MFWLRFEGESFVDAVNSTLKTESSLSSRQIRSIISNWFTAASLVIVTLSRGGMGGRPNCFDTNRINLVVLIVGRELYREKFTRANVTCPKGLGEAYPGRTISEWKRLYGRPRQSDPTPPRYCTLRRKLVQLHPPQVSCQVAGSNDGLCGWQCLLRPREWPSHEGECRQWKKKEPLLCLQSCRVRRIP